MGFFLLLYIKNCANNMTNSNQDNRSQDNIQNANVDLHEIAKFNQLANAWWDKNGVFKPLHDINPLRLGFIEKVADGVAGKRVLDVGCGGGILAHSLSYLGANVVGIDMGYENIAAAIAHNERMGANVDYRCTAIEDLAKTGEKFEVVACMEMLEHVPNPKSVIEACFELLVDGGTLVLSTINRNPKSYLFAIIGAEHILRLLPKGTHEFAKFITPTELDKMVIDSGFIRHNMIGLHYNPITRRYWLAPNVDVNYMMAVKKPFKL